MLSPGIDISWQFLSQFSHLQPPCRHD